MLLSHCKKGKAGGGVQRHAVVHQTIVSQSYELSFIIKIMIKLIEYTVLNETFRLQ